MKKNYLKLKLLFSTTLVLMISLNNVIAQDDITSLFKGGVTDLNTLANGYLKPMGTGFAANLGSNWYNTAAPHKLLGFDLTIGAGIAMVPTVDQTFSVKGLTNLTPVGTGVTRCRTSTSKAPGEHHLVL